MLALDWKKAFDCIEPERLLTALKRFGVSDPMCEAIANIYQDRLFWVRDTGQKSDSRPQLAGISQGCALSPFLFGILMTVLMTDAQALLCDDARKALQEGNPDPGK